jgi:hypothetical protein
MPAAELTTPPRDACWTKSATMRITLFAESQRTCICLSTRFTMLHV